MVMLRQEGSYHRLGTILMSVPVSLDNPWYKFILAIVLAFETCNMTVPRLHSKPFFDNV